ncbi:hypothetical protein ACYSNR_00860 [Enterococcus sp. LJL128]
MKNKHSTDGIAEDIIRSFVQIASAEMHAKTLLEKRVSELENGFIDFDSDTPQQLEKIEDLKEEINTLAELRRSDMLYLFNLYGATGDKEKWCSVKHLGIAMMTAFEAWQASDSDEDLLSAALNKNRLFIKAVSQFLGVEVTECAACFADILKGGAPDET